MKGLHTKENGTVSWNGHVIAVNKELSEYLTALTAYKEKQEELVQGGMKYGKSYREAVKLYNIVSSMEEGKTLLHISSDRQVKITVQPSKQS